ncbi:glutamate racemase [Candidatus Saccharibacteria bacterium oral taxon 488]|jgi:glutamate racemase|nr:glutamate racemase [Candidatus Saccharibacteria bacterium oral taxon 488]
MKIGVFDTGTGGELVAKRLKKLLPQHSYITAIDREHAPYGNRSSEEIITLTDTAIQPLLSCSIIILACNTATTIAIQPLRQRYSDVRFIGFEPMIKPAATLTKSRHITLLATNATKHSQRLRALISEYATGVRIDTPDTRAWAQMIDQGLADDIVPDEVSASVADGSDVIVLGCTHYLAIKRRLQRLFPQCRILEPTAIIAKRISDFAS